MIIAKKIQFYDFDKKRGFDEKFYFVVLARQSEIIFFFLNFLDLYILSIWAAQF